MKNFEFLDLDYYSGKKLPVVFVLDVSGSMNIVDKTGVSCVNQLNLGFKVFLDSILKDEVAANALDLSIITFGDNKAEVFLDFDQWKGENIKNFTAQGGTPMGEALITAYKQISERKLVYKDYGIDYYQPWVILMTDGEPTDNIDYGRDLFIDLLNNKKVSLFPVAIGADANLQVLNYLNPNINPLTIQGTDFQEFFIWLSKSVEDNEMDFNKYSGGKNGKK